MERARTAGMHRERATVVQRVGIFIALVEVLLLASMAALHLGLEWQIGNTRLAAPHLQPAGFLEASVALMLLASVLLPSTGENRAGAVLAAQILLVLGMLVGQIALMRGAALETVRQEIFYGVVLLLALTSIGLVASPGTAADAS